MRVGLGATHLINRIFTHSVGSASAVRWRTAHIKLLCSSSDESRGSRSSLLRHLTSKIQATGPITVAEYMREVLTNPLMGYYVRNDMLGPDGDFITSPEISQIFGELIGVWIISEWIGAGRPKQLQLVELGPGKGSLAADILRVFTQLHSVIGDASVSLHLVEVSPVLSRIQAQELTRTCSHEVDNTDTPVYCSGETATGLPVSWYRRLEDVPAGTRGEVLWVVRQDVPTGSALSAGFSIFLAHEFFDALPVHKFEVNLVSFEEPLKGFQGFLSGSCLCQRTPKGWREVLVDIHPEKPEQLRFVLAPSPTLASSALVQADERRSHVEVCAEGGVLVQQLARRVAEHGGAALIADYGHDGTKTDTLRGFKGHRQHHVLADPGSADLTADVDFRYLRRMAGGGVACMGPLAQRAFLKNMGIDARMQVLLRNCTDASTRKQLINSYALLTDPAQMGERFNFFCLLHHGRLVQPQVLTGLKLEKRSPAQLPVAGFTELSYS